MTQPGKGFSSNFVSAKKAATRWNFSELDNCVNYFVLTCNEQKSPFLNFKSHRRKSQVSRWTNGRKLHTSENSCCKPAVAEGRARKWRSRCCIKIPRHPAQRSSHDVVKAKEDRPYTGMASKLCWAPRSP